MLLIVPKEHYTVKLGTVLSRKAMEEYASLSPEVTADYDRLKTTLLTAFNKTAGYLHEFKSSKIVHHETFERFTSNFS